jgi:DNA-binding transcriptional MerR regulator
MTQPDNLPLVEPEESELYTPAEVAELFRVDPKTVARWDKNGVFEKNGVNVVRTMGNHRRFYKKEIDALKQRMSSGEPKVP